MGRIFQRSNFEARYSVYMLEYRGDIRVLLYYMARVFSLKM